MKNFSMRIIVPLFACGWLFFDWPTTMSDCAPTRIDYEVPGSGAKLLKSHKKLTLYSLRGGSTDGATSTTDEIGVLQKPLKTGPMGPKSYARRDLLLRLQNEAQKKWDDEKIFEEDAPEDFDPDTPNGNDKTPPKYFCTFPYPYMNGLLHLGHAYSLSKAEFAVGYQRMRGK